MSIYDFIQEEFKSIAVSEAKQLLETELLNSVIQEIEQIHFGNELEDLEEKLINLEKNKGFLKLKLTNTISIFLLNLYNLEYEIQDLIRIQNLMDKNPDNKLLPLIWVFYQLDAFEEDELLEKDVADFFQVLFNRFDYLIELDDFFENTDIAISTLNQTRLKQSAELLYPVFKDALKQYPENFAIKRLLGEISYHHNLYQVSIELLLDVLKDILNNDALDELNRIEIMEYLALNYDKLGDDKKVEEYINEIMNNLPIISFSDGTEEIAVDFTIDAFFLNMRLNMKKNDVQKVKEDFELVKSGILVEALEECEKDYPDVIEYVEKMSA